MAKDACHDSRSLHRQFPSHKAKITVPFPQPEIQSAIPRRGMLLKESIAGTQRDIRVPMFIAELVTTAER